MDDLPSFILASRDMTPEQLDQLIREDMEKSRRLMREDVLRNLRARPLGFYGGCLAEPVQEEPRLGIDSEIEMHAAVRLTMHNWLRRRAESMGRMASDFRFTVPAQIRLFPDVFRDALENESERMAAYVESRQNRFGPGGTPPEEDLQHRHDPLYKPPKTEAEKSTFKPVAAMQDSFDSMTDDQAESYIRKKAGNALRYSICSKAKTDYEHFVYRARAEQLVKKFGFK